MDLFSLLTMNAAVNPAFNQSLLYPTQANTSPLQESNEVLKLSGVERGQKRKRLRRHPVWEYFGDIADKVVGCKLCSFNTVSAFSTNLKMHLKSHHKNEFIQVMEKELDQLIKEEPENHDELPSKSPASDLDISAPRTKRKRKTAQELRETINRCKQSIERDRSRHLPFSIKNNTQSLTTGNVDIPQSKSISPMTIEVDQTPQLTKIDLHSTIELLKSLDQDSQYEKFVTEIRKNLRDTALTELISQISPDVILSTAFQNFLWTMDPTYKLSDEIFQRASNSKSSI